MGDRYGLSWCCSRGVSPHHRSRVCTCPALELAVGSHLGGISGTACSGCGAETICTFLQVERCRESLGIEEYSISQTTLEQVFVALAQNDIDSRLVHAVHPENVE
jgi:hypothetical protein